MNADGSTPVLSLKGVSKSFGPVQALSDVDFEVKPGEVVALVAHGFGNDEIAERLVVTPATAKTHVSRAMVKLNAHDRAKLVVFAYEVGLVAPRAEAPHSARRGLSLAT